MTQTPTTLTSTSPPSNSPKRPDHHGRNSEGAIEMTHTIHDISVANHIGKYSDAIAVGPNMRWLMTSGTPGLSAASDLPNDITGQAELAWHNVMNLLAKADMTVADIVKVTQYLTRAEDSQGDEAGRTGLLGNNLPS